jgi:hypothetical protein
MRGLIAVWILFHHSLFYSTLNVDLMGAVSTHKMGASIGQRKKVEGSKKFKQGAALH